MLSAASTPIARGRRCVPPAPGSSPSFTSGSATEAVADATRKWHASASSRPPPTQAPLIAAMTGLVLASFPCLCSDLEPFPPDRIVGAQLQRVAFEHDPAVPHHVEPMANRQRDRQFLLDDKDGDASRSDLLQQFTDECHHLGREPFG